MKHFIGCVHVLLHHKQLYINMSMVIVVSVSQKLWGKNQFTEV